MTTVRVRRLVSLRGLGLELGEVGGLAGPRLACAAQRARRLDIAPHVAVPAYTAACADAPRHVLRGLWQRRVALETALLQPSVRRLQQQQPALLRPLRRRHRALQRGAARARRVSSGNTTVAHVRWREYVCKFAVGTRHWPGQPAPPPPPPPPPRPPRARRRPWRGTGRRVLCGGARPRGSRAQRQQTQML